MHHMRSKQGFTMLELLLVVGLIGLLVLAFSSSQLKNLQARKTVEAKLGYQEVSSTMRSLLAQVLRSPPSSGCFGFASLKAATSASPIVGIEQDVAGGLGAREKEFIALPHNENIRRAVERCRKPQDISAANDPNDNKLFLCALFKNQAQDTNSVLLNSPHAFGEFWLEFANAQSGQPFSCDAYRTSKLGGVNVYYNIYWLSGKSDNSNYTKQTGYYYVGK